MSGQMSTLLDTAYVQSQNLGVSVVLRFESSTTNQSFTHFTKLLIELGTYQVMLMLQIISNTLIILFTIRKKQKQNLTPTLKTQQKKHSNEVSTNVVLKTIAAVVCF